MKGSATYDPTYRGGGGICHLWWRSATYGPIYGGGGLSPMVPSMVCLPMALWECRPPAHGQTNMSKNSSFLQLCLWALRMSRTIFKVGEVIGII